MLFQKMANYGVIGNFIQTTFDWLLAERGTTTLLLQICLEHKQEWKKSCRNFSMRNFRYILGLLKNTLSRVKIRDLTLTFFIVSSKKLILGTAAI